MNFFFFKKTAKKSPGWSLHEKSFSQGFFQENVIIKETQNTEVKPQVPSGTSHYHPYSLKQLKEPRRTHYLGVLKQDEDNNEMVQVAPFTKIFFSRCAPIVKQNVKGFFFFNIFLGKRK